MAETATQYGHADEKEALLNRLRRAEGQVRGVARMVERDKYCIDITKITAAAQAALDRVALEQIREHAKHCLSVHDGLSINHRRQGRRVGGVIAAFSVADYT